MFRMTTLKFSLFSALATLMLLIAMLATSGTASAHTANSQAKAFPHPHIEVNDVTPTYGNCDEVSLVGFGFAPGQIKLFASQHHHPITVSPPILFTNGSFSRDVTVCGDFGLSYGPIWSYGHGLGYHHGLGYVPSWGYGYCPGYGYGWGYGWGYGDCFDYAPMVLVAVGSYGGPSNHVIL